MKLSLMPSKTELFTFFTLKQTLRLKNITIVDELANHTKILKIDKLGQGKRRKFHMQLQLTKISQLFQRLLIILGRSTHYSSKNVKCG